MTRNRLLVIVLVMAVGLLLARLAMVTASTGELEFVGFPSQIVVAGEEVQLQGWLKFNQEEHEYSSNIRLWVAGHEGRIEPKFIAGPLYDGDMVPITVYLEGVAGVATMHADDPRCPRGSWTITLVVATPTSTPTSTPTGTPTSTPTPTHTPTTTLTPTPTPTSTATPTPTPTPKLGVPFQLPILRAEEGWETLIQVQNVGFLPTGAIMLLWGDYSGSCPPNDPGPIARRCSDPIPPGSAWTVRGDVLAGATGAIVYPVSLDQLSTKCEEARNAVGDSSAWLTWVQEWEAEARGGVLAVTVHRVGPNSDGRIVSSAYTGISEDLEASPPFDYFVPLNKRAHNGFDTELDIQNSGQFCHSVWVYYQGQGVCESEHAQHIEQVAPGEVYLTAVPAILGDGWLGSAFISSSVPLGIVVDEWGQGMLFTYQVPLLEQVSGSLVNYAPLVYVGQDWGAVIHVQHLGQTGQPTFVTVTFLDENGEPVLDPLSEWICAGGSQAFSPAFDEVPGRLIGAAVIESQSHIVPPGQDEIPGSPIYAVARLFNPVTQHGASYNAIPQDQVEGTEAMALPLLVKNDAGQSSEIAIRNNSSQNTLHVELDIYDASSLLATIPVTIGPNQIRYRRLGDTFASLSAGLGNVPADFVGSGVIRVTDVEGDGPAMLAAVVVERDGGTGDLIEGYEGIPLRDGYPYGPMHTPTPTPTAISTVTLTPTGTPTTIHTPTSTPTATPTTIHSPTSTPTVTPTFTPTSTPGWTPTATPTHTPPSTLEWIVYIPVVAK